MLHVACYEGHVEMVTYLLTKYREEDLNLRDKVLSNRHCYCCSTNSFVNQNGWTPLHCAASQRHYEICEILLKKGASPNSQNGTLTSPFTYAVR